ncbi:MAG: RIP metalloprotease RseP [Aquificaceae bacterium]
MEYLLWFLILVGVLVWFHELGHFLFAKLFGVKVEVFSVGFGPSVLQKKVGETIYRIGAIPLGGYVKLFGEEGQENSPDAFSAKPNWQKILIGFAGPLFNLILAVFLFATVFFSKREVPSYLLEPVVAGQVAEGSIAHKLGIKPGDRIIELNSKSIQNWKELQDKLSRSIFDKNWQAKVERNGEVLNLELKGASLAKSGRVFGIEPTIPPIIGRVVPNSPASQVGLKPGDRVLSINSKPVNSWQELTKEIKNSKNNNLELELQRENQTINLTIVPQKDPKTQMPVIGIAPQIKTSIIQTSLNQAISMGVQKTVELTSLTYRALYELLTGGVSLNSLGGPITIAQLATDSAQQGIFTFLYMMALISVQLAIFNLLPLPVLDGGLILLYAMESLRRKPFSMKFKEMWMRVGYAFIIGLTIVVFLNDIFRVFSGKSP